MHIATGLQHIQGIREAARGAGASASILISLEIAGKLELMSSLIVEKILATLVDTPPATAAKGDTIRPGVSEDLDRLRKIASGGREFLVELQQRESGRSGISS